MARIQAMADHLIVCGVVLFLATVAGAGQCRAGDEALPQAAPAESDVLASESILSPDSVLSRDDWKLRIDQARKRSDQARQEWKLNAPLRAAIPPEPPEKIATRRVLSDDTLQPGDIVSTDKGFFLFRGRSGQDRQDVEFTPVTPR